MWKTDSGQSPVDIFFITFLKNNSFKNLFQNFHLKSFVSESQKRREVRHSTFSASISLLSLFRIFLKLPSLVILNSCHMFYFYTSIFSFPLTHFHRLFLLMHTFQIFQNSLTFSTKRNQNETKELLVCPVSLLLSCSLLAS